jgi:hypothetical protein
MCVSRAYRNMLDHNVITDAAYFTGNTPYSIRPYSSHVVGEGRGLPVARTISLRTEWPTGSSRIFVGARGLV